MNVQCCICTSELIELITEDASRMDRQSKFSNFRICLVAKKTLSKRLGDRIFHILTIPVSGTVVPLIKWKGLTS